MKKAKRVLQVGKVPMPLLRRLLARNIISDKRVIIGPRIGEDAAAIDFGDRYLVAKTDPITFATDRIGWYAININANDIATMGATPKWFLATTLLPEKGTTDALVRSIFNDLMKSCRSLNIDLIGGHTEITYDLPRPIVVGQMLGEVPKAKLVRKENASPDDDIILTKGIAIEGTSIIAREREKDVISRFGKRFLHRAKRFLTEPGISVVADALTANSVARVHAMHDPTEGGLATGLLELAEAAGVGLEVNLDSIPIFEETRALCNAFGLNPLGLIASGALIIAAPRKETPRIISALKRRGIEAVRIGRVTAKGAGLKIIADGRRRTLPRFDVDEITRIF